MGSIAEEFKQKQNKDRIPSSTEAAAKSLWEYEKQINPRFFKEDRWHLKEIATTLQALVEDRIIKRVPETEWHIATPEEVAELQEGKVKYLVCKKLKLNIPPRHGKSYSLQMFEQWYLGVNNDNTVITVSYNETLSSRFSSNVRDGIDATKIDKKITIFSDIFPNTKIKYGDAAKNIWALAGRFFSYLGTSFGGTLTGVGCRLGVIDDPVKSDTEAYNDSVLNDQWDWYVDTYLSRIEEGGYQIINMTRWSTKDLCGRLESEEESDEWYTLQYPACLNAEKVFKVVECRKSHLLKNCKDCPEFPCEVVKDEPLDDDGNMIGKMMCPDLLSFKSWNSKRKLTSLPIFLANYQQQPVDVTGAVYAQGFKTYDPDTYDPTLAEKKRSYTDTADTGSDSLCSICFDEIDGYAYIRDVYFTDEDMSITEKETARRLKVNDVREAVIESNNGGRGFARNVERILKTKMHWKRTSINWFFQGKNKRSRILSHSSNVCEQIIMPEGWEKRWPDFYKHLMAYQRKSKSTEHDDAPDCLTGVVEFMNGELKVKQKVKTARKSRLGIR
ncbi:MAG: phage terminase large subunit [Lachnospiraceae bacterium]|nr:phage terminase large subunit [Lachnospiraceae bacterium]